MHLPKLRFKLGPGTYMHVYVCIFLSPWVIPVNDGIQILHRYQAHKRTDTHKPNQAFPAVKERRSSMYALWKTTSPHLMLASYIRWLVTNPFLPSLRQHRDGVGQRVRTLIGSARESQRWIDQQFTKKKMGMHGTGA